jgi:hypothetical protein
MRKTFEREQSHRMANDVEGNSSYCPQSSQ